MKIAVMSDSHDNIWNMRKALSAIRQSNAEMIIHCGDFVAPFMLKELEAAGIAVHGVFGNNDGDRHLLTKLSLTDLKNITLHSLVGQVEVDGLAIAFTHQRVVAEALAAGGRYRLVCFGHSHEFFAGKVGETLLLNPGEIMGKEGRPGFCLVETESLEFERIELADFHPGEKNAHMPLDF